MNFRILAVTAAVLASAFVALPSAHAATTYDNQKITEIAAGGAYNGDVVIKLSGHSEMTRPACATSGWSLRFDATTDAGKQAYSMALLAQSSGANLALSGEPVCIRNIQQMRWIRLK